MKTLGFLAATVAAMIVPAVAMAQIDSRTMVTGGGSNNGAATGVRTPVADKPVIVVTPNTTMPGASRQGLRNWGSRAGGRWSAGDRAPGGWGAYRSLGRGRMLPGYWVQRDFFIGDYARYGLPAPRSGAGWSRYYDDAVLSDRSGRVIDSVRGIDWGQYDSYANGSEDYSDSYGYRDDGMSRDQRGATYGDAAPARERDRDGGLGGAAIGGAVGAVAGNVIGGRGNRLAGSLLGGAVGVVAGGVIDRSDNAGRGERQMSRREREAFERGRRAGATYDEGYQSEGDYRDGAHWDRDRGYDGGRYGRSQRYVYRQPYGYYYGGGETIITVNSAPITTQTTTTTYTTEYVSHAKKAVYKRHARKRVYHRPRPRAQCHCR